MASEEEDLYTGAPLQVGDEAPNFTCDSHLGMITLHEVLDGQFSMLVTFPHDFEAVATTELGAIAKLQEEFEGELQIQIRVVRRFVRNSTFASSPSSSPIL